MKNIWFLFSFVCISIHVLDVRAGKPIEILRSKLMNSEATNSEKIDAVKDFLRSEAGINTVDMYHGRTALMSAAELGSKEAVELLLQKGADVNAVNSNNSTALIYAVKSKSKEVVELLLEKVANINLADFCGTTALMYAAGLGFNDAIALLLEKGADINAVSGIIGRTALMVAAGSGSKDSVRLLLKKGANVNATSSTRRTVLMYAAESKSKETVELVLEKEVDINAANDTGKTALMYAAESGSESVVELLLKNGANINAFDRNERTALMYAAKSGSKKTVEFLLGNGLSIHVVDSCGDTLLMYAARSGSKEAVELLLKKGANVHAVDHGGSTALMKAMYEKRAVTIKLLKDYMAFKFVQIDQEFVKEPELEDYIADEKMLALATDNDQEDQQDRAEKLIKKFQKDHAAYWQNEIQKAYKELIFRNNAAPLRALLSQEIYEKPILMQTFANCFNSREAFLEIQERLKKDARGEELNRLQEMMNVEKDLEEKAVKFENYTKQNMAAYKIQHAFEKYKQQKQQELSFFNSGKDFVKMQARLKNSGTGKS